MCILGWLRYLASRNWYSDKYYNAHKRHIIIKDIWRYINMSSSSWERYPGRSPSRWTVQNAMGSCVDRRHQGVLSSSRGLPAWHWGRWAIWACCVPCVQVSGVGGQGWRSRTPPQWKTSESSQHSLQVMGMQWQTVCKGQMGSQLCLRRSWGQQCGGQMGGRWSKGLGAYYPKR